MTGANGQVGRQVVARALARGVAVRGMGSRELDITDADAVKAQVKPGSVVVNCAAYTAVDAAETDESTAHAVNEVGPRNLAGACAAAGARLIHVSTDYVFSGEADTPYETDASTCPLTVYGRTKLAGEVAVHDVMPDALIVRTAWVYTGSGSDFVATMRRLEAERDTVKVVTDQVGSPTFAGDLAEGLLQLVESGELAETVLHATNGGEASWFDLARAVFEEVGADPDRVQACTSAEFERPAPRPAYSVLSGRAWADAGLRPLPHWREALHTVLA